MKDVSHQVVLYVKKTTMLNQDFIHNNNNTMSMFPFFLIWFYSVIVALATFYLIAQRNRRLYSKLETIRLAVSLVF